MTIKIDGLKELRRELRKLPGNVQRRVIQSATRAGAVIIRDEARRRAPKDRGILEKSIIIKKSRRSSNSSIVFSIGPSKKAYYGYFVELGTRFQSPQPFLVPALVENEGAIIKQMANRMRRGVIREVRKLKTKKR